MTGLSGREVGESSKKDVLRTAGRGVGMISAPLRPLPDFLIIGAKRGGTTSFYYDLLAHPCVSPMFPPPIPTIKPLATKGAHYFDSNYCNGERWYRSYFPSNVSRFIRTQRSGSESVTGEASPYYLFHPAAAARAHQTVPNARIIAILREPAMRTYSHWKERRRSKAEPLDFLEALEAEPQRLSGERERLLADDSYVSYAWEQQSYRTQSIYVDALRPWVDLYGKSRVLVVTSEAYYADPNAVLGDAQEFLGLQRVRTASNMVRNAAEGLPLPANVERGLRQSFAEHNTRLRTLLDIDVPWA